jgi:hypothetical protein
MKTPDFLNEDARLRHGIVELKGIREPARPFPGYPGDEAPALER